MDPFKDSDFFSSFPDAALVAVAKGRQPNVEIFPHVVNFVELCSCASRRFHRAREPVNVTHMSGVVLLLPFVPLVATVRLLQGALGMGGALAVGWAVFPAVLAPIMYARWTAEDQAAG